MSKFRNFLNKAWFIIKTFFKGLATTCFAAIALENIPVIIRLVKAINTSTGWSVLGYFGLILLCSIVFVAVSFSIGTLVNDSNELYEYKCKCKEHNNDGGTIYMDPAAVNRSDKVKSKKSQSSNKTSDKQ